MVPGDAACRCGEAADGWEVSGRIAPTVRRLMNPGVLLTPPLPSAQDLSVGNGPAHTQGGVSVLS